MKKISYIIGVVLVASIVFLAYLQWDGSTTQAQDPAGITQIRIGQQVLWTTDFNPNVDSAVSIGSSTKRLLYIWSDYANFTYSSTTSATTTNLHVAEDLVVLGFGQFNNVTTTDTIASGGYTTSTGGFYTQADIRAGGDLEIEGSATTTSKLVVGSTQPTTDDILFVGGNIFSTGYVTSTTGIFTQANIEAGGNLIIRGTGSFANDVFTIDASGNLNTTGYASTTDGLNTQGSGHIGTNLVVDGTGSFALAKLTIDSSGNLITDGHATTTTGLFTQGDGHVGGDMTIDGTLAVVGGVTFGGSASTTGYHSVGTDDGNFNFTAGDLNASGDLYVGGSATTTGDLVISGGDLNKDGTTLTIGGDLLISGHTTSTGSLNIDGDLQVDGTANFDGAVTGIALDEIENPAGDKTFNLASNKEITFASVDTTPTAGEGVFNITASGAFTGDLLHVHQHTGNPGYAHLLHLEAEDADIVPLAVSGIASTTMFLAYGTTEVPHTRAEFYIDSNGNLEIDLISDNATTTFTDNLRIDGADLRVNGSATTTGSMYVGRNLYLDDDASYPRGLAYSAGAGVIEFLPYEAAGTTDIGSRDTFYIYSNMEADGSGSFEPTIVMSNNGKLSAKNTTQGDAGNRYFEIAMTDGLVVTMGGIRAGHLNATTTLSDSATTTGSLYLTYETGATEILMVDTTGYVYGVATSSLNIAVSDLVGDTDDLAEGSSNLYYTQARVWDDTWASTTLDTILTNSQTAYGWGDHSTLYLLNGESDTMTGTLTADGLTIGSTELITIGTNLFTHDGTDFTLDDTLEVTGYATSTSGLNTQGTLHVGSTGLVEGTFTLPALGDPAGKFLAVNASGDVIATTTPAGTAPSGSDNEVLTDDGSSGITSESNLTFDGSTLTITGVASSTTGFNTQGSIHIGTNLTVDGTLTGEASTATALAANGANCTNQFPLGVDASGAVENCTTVNSTYMDMTAAYTGSGIWTFSSDLRAIGGLHATSTDFDALMVNGNGTTTGAFYAGNGINIATGQTYKINGTALACSNITNCVASAWDNLNDMTLNTGLFYFGDGSNNPVATSTIYLDTTGNLGVGTTSPDVKFHVEDTSEQLRLGYDWDSYAGFAVDSSGDMTIDLNTGDATTTISDNLEVSGHASTSALMIGGANIIHFGNGMCIGEDTATTTPNITTQACGDF